MLRETVLEQQVYLRWHEHRKNQVTPRTQLRESDQVMYWLEECMERDLKLVPGWILPRLGQVLNEAGPEFAARLGRERRPQALLDLLFEAQEALMGRSVASRRPAPIIPLFR